MQSYLHLLQRLLDEGTAKPDRTATGTRSLFGYQTRYALQDRFPLVTTKKVHWPAVVHELLWFLRGDTNVHYLQERGVTIWNEWADAEGNLGPVYGKQWRAWRGYEDEQRFDQIAWVVDELQHNPHSRRLLVSAWNVAELDQMALAPCHVLFQFYVANGQLSCQVYQRSADVFLGLPFNIASYALLTRLMAQVTGLQPGELIHTLGDVHLYSNHAEQARLQLSRIPRELPKLRLNPLVNSLATVSYNDIVLEEYHPYPAIPAPVAV